jgi:hypothetical protein
MTLIQFSQNLMQGGWIHKDPYMQLPLVDQQMCGKMKNKLGGMTLFNYCMKPAEERKALINELFSDKNPTEIVE